MGNNFPGFIHNPCFGIENGFTRLNTGAKGSQTPLHNRFEIIEFQIHIYKPALLGQPQKGSPESTRINEGGQNTSVNNTKGLHVKRSKTTSDLSNSILCNAMDM